MPKHRGVPSISTLMRARGRGVLLGQIVGDALGTTVEFSSRETIRRQFPNGLRDVVGGGPFHVLAGQITDDTELALALGRCLVQSGWDLNARAEAYATWRKSEPFDVGTTTGAAFGGWGSAVRADAMLARTEERNGAPSQQANGALMRVSPLGIFGALLDMKVLAQRACEDARFSHPSSVCQAANAAFVRAIQVGLLGGSPQEGYEAGTRAAAEGGAKVVAAALEDVDRQPDCDGQSQGWVIIALRNAFHVLLHERTFEEALVKTVMAGGDTNTNGCIAGALLGAFHGVDAIPPRWVVKVLSCRTSRGPTYQTADAIGLADALLDRGATEADGQPLNANTTGVASSDEKQAPPVLDEAVRIAKVAGGRQTAHDRTPETRLVIKIPLRAVEAREKVESLLGVAPLRGQKYWVFDIEKRPAAARSSPSSMARSAKPVGKGRAGVRTSETHPIRVDWLLGQTTPGKVGLTIAPGKHSSSKYSSGSWGRDLDKDLGVLVNDYNVNVLVCLLEDGDLHRLQIPNLKERAEAHGLEVVHFPIKDVSVPTDHGAVQGLVKGLLERCRTGKNVVVHCEGGLGRTGTIAGCYLTLFGHGADDILQRLGESRQDSNCPETEEQRQFIRDFAAKLRAGHPGE